MKRFTMSQLSRSVGLRPRAPGKIAAHRQYLQDKAVYLAAHPFCQIHIAIFGLDEALVIERGGKVSAGGQWFVPRSTDIHHRNKRDGERLLDQRWWISCCRENHDLVERCKAWARDNGLLLPIQADSEGRWGTANQALTTPEFLVFRIKKVIAEKNP